MGRIRTEWKAENSLAHWVMREYLIYEQGRTLGYEPRATTGAKTAALAYAYCWYS